MTKRKTQEQFVQEMFEIHPDIEVLGTYVNNKVPVRCRCLKDGYEWDGIPAKMICSGHGCPVCGGSMKLTTEIFVAQMKEINPYIEIEGEYINSDTKISCHCLRCNNHWEAIPYHLKAGEDCPICARGKLAQSLSLTLEEFKEKLKKVDETIEVTGDYVNNRTNIKCHCTVCNNDWEASPGNLLAGKGCPVCASSKGEKKIRKQLEEHKVNFVQEYRFNDCRDIKPLPFDFYLKDKNLLIEFDGPHHFKEVKWFGKNTPEEMKEYFEGVKRRDKIKNDYCKEKGIQLLRIPYTDIDKIEEILNEVIFMQQ